MTKNYSCIETFFVDPATLSNQELQQIYELEQDTWARENVLGEYIKCNECGIISSKENIFGHREEHLRRKTVAEIERMLEMKDIPCSFCFSLNTKHIYGEENYQVTLSSLRSPNAFLAVSKVDKQIVGYVNGYADTLKMVYEKELSSHFEPELVGYIEDILGIQLGESVVTVSGLGMSEATTNIFHMFELTKKLFSQISLSLDVKVWIMEAIIGSFPHFFYKSMGACSFPYYELLKYAGGKSKNDKVALEVLYQTGVVTAYKTKLSVPVGKFIKDNKPEILKLIKNG